MYDAFGKLVFTSGTNVIDGATYVPINLEGARSAQYYIRATVNGEVITKSVIVMN